LEPGDRLIEAVQLDQVRPDVVVRIPEGRVDRDRALALLDRVVVPAQEAEGPSVERVRLSRRREFERSLIGVRGPFELPGTLEDVRGLERPSRRLLARVLPRVEGMRVQRTSLERIVHVVPEVLIVM